MTTVIEVSNISKQFKIHHERHTAVKERLLHPKSGTTELFSALVDIDFKISDNETVGIVGQNGSGKSTLLKCICGVLQPTMARFPCAEAWRPCWSWAPGFSPR